MTYSEALDAVESLSDEHKLRLAECLREELYAPLAARDRQGRDMRDVGSANARFDSPPCLRKSEKAGATRTLEVPAQPTRCPA